MTEIPEHLLKRSKERRAALGGDAGDGAGSDSPAAPAAAAVAKVESAAPAAAPKAAAPAAPPPPKPDPAYIAAAKSRKKIPFWAMATLSLLPIWGFMYLQGVKPEAKVVSGPLGDGAEVYNSAACASCHGAAGGGGVGRQLSKGEVRLTFPHIEDQLNFVYDGTNGFRGAGLTEYGNPDRPGGVRGTGSFGVMPSQGAKSGGGLTESEILAVVCHERFTIDGVAPTDPAVVEEFELWCSEESPIAAGLEDGSITFDDVATKIEGVIPVGTEARPGTAPTAG